jgi:protein SCO1/2
MAISPEGKISRYLLGIQFNPFDVKMALLDAESGKTNPTVAKVLQFCFSYDPEGRGYSLNVTRISGVIVFALLGLFLFGVVLRKKKSVT